LTLAREGSRVTSGRHLAGSFDVRYPAIERGNQLPQFLD
jgi:hypothetical protein